MTPSQQPVPPSPPYFTVAIVEDEPVLREELAFQLGHLGFAVEAFDSAGAFYRYLAVKPRTIVLLDIGLPGEDGLTMCRHLRRHDAQIGIVFLTARALRDERLTGLSAGADAYLTKPVDMDELVLILNRLALRLSPLVSEPPTQGAWHMAPGSGYLSAPNGIQVRLSVSEGQLLRALQSKSGQICPHVELALALSQHPEEFDKHRIEVIVSRLKSKVERVSGQNLPLQSVRGVGYTLNPG